MEDKRNLDDLIRSSFDKINKGAPDGLWGKLSSVLDADAESLPSTEKDLSHNPLDTKIKESFSSLNRKAPEHVWTAINRQLNIERVWEGLNKELDKTRPLFRPRNLIAAAVLLLFLFSTGIYLSLSRDAVRPGMADMEEKEISKNGESFTAFDSEEIIEERKETKEQKAIIFNQPAILEEETIHSKISVTADADSGKKDQKKGVTEEGNAAYQKRAFQDSRGIENRVDTIESSSFFSKEGGFLPSLPASTNRKALDVKRLPDNNYSIRSATKSSNERPSQIIGHETHAVTLVTTNGVSSDQLLTNEILSLKVNSLPFIQEKNTIFIKVESISLDALPVQEIALESPLDKNKRKPLKIQNVEAGPVWVYHNSWLLNNETRNSLDKNSLISSDPTYKQNWGLALNYNITGKSTIATEVHFFSKSGQKYKMYGEGKYLKKGLELRYHKIYLQYQRQLLGRGTGMPGWFTVKAGVYGGVLQEKLGEIRQEESRYASFDYGLRLAAGQENKLGRIVIGYGLSTERGLNNVFRGTEKLPAAFNKTYIQNFGTYLNIRYAF